MYNTRHCANCKAINGYSVLFLLPEVPTVGDNDGFPISAMPSITVIIKPSIGIVFISYTVSEVPNISHSERFPISAMPSITLIIKPPICIVLIS